MDDAIGLLGNPPLAKEEVVVTGSVAGLGLARCARISQVVTVREIETQSIDEASALASCGGHPYVKLLGGCSHDGGGIKLLFEMPAGLASQLAQTPGEVTAASPVSGGMSAILRSAIQLLEFCTYARLQGVALLALPQSDVGVTASGHLSVLGLRHAIALPQSTSPAAAAGTAVISLQHVQRALRGLQPGSSVIRQLAPESLTSFQSAQARLGQLRQQQQQQQPSAAAAPAVQASAIPVPFDADKHAAFMCGVWVSDLLGEYTAAQAAKQQQQQQQQSVASLGGDSASLLPAETEAEQASRRVLLQLVSGLTQPAAEQRWSIGTALAVLEVVGASSICSLPPPPLPPVNRLVLLTVQLPPPSLQSPTAADASAHAGEESGTRPSSSSSSAAAASHGAVVRRVLVPVTPEATVATLASRALAAAQGLSWPTQPSHSNLLDINSNISGGVSTEPGSAHVVLQVPPSTLATPYLDPASGLLLAPPARMAALLHPSSQVTSAWDLLTSPDSELLPVVVVAAGAMVERLKRLPVLTPQPLMPLFSSTSSSLLSSGAAASGEVLLQPQAQTAAAAPVSLLLSPDDQLLPASDATLLLGASKSAGPGNSISDSRPSGGSPIPGSDIIGSARITAAGSPATVTSLTSSGGGTDAVGSPEHAGTGVTPPRHQTSTPPPVGSAAAPGSGRTSATTAPVAAISGLTSSLGLGGLDLPSVSTGAAAAGIGNAAVGLEVSKLDSSAAAVGRSAGTGFSAVSAASSAASAAGGGIRRSPLLGSPASSPAHPSLTSGLSTGRSSAVPVTSPAGTPMRPASSVSAAASGAVGGSAAVGTRLAVVSALSSSSSSSSSSSILASSVTAVPSQSPAHISSAASAAAPSISPPLAEAVAGAGTVAPKPQPSAGAPLGGFPTVVVSAGGAVGAAALPATASASHDDASFVIEAVSRLRPFGIRASVQSGSRITIELPRVPAAPAAAALVASAAGKAAASARDARVTSLRELMRDLQDRSHTRDDGRLAGFGALGFLEITLGALFASCFLSTAKDEPSASFALQIVGNLAMNDGNRRKLAELHGIELVTAAMGVHATSARVQKDAIVALRHLAYENDANKQRIVDCGAVSAVVKAMLACGDSAQVQRQACGALSIFAVHSALGDAAKRTIVASGGLGAITKAMQSFMSDTQLVTAALKSLGTLIGMPDARSAARELGALELCEALGSMSEHAGARDFQEALKQTQRRLAPAAGK